MCKFPLTDSTNTATEAEAALALLLLGGCPTCGKPFRQKDGTLICCGVSYCPHCALPHSARCVHLVARSEWNHWSIAGASMRHRSTFPYPLSKADPLDFSATEWEAAFGADWKRFAPLWGNCYYWESAGEKAVSEWLVGNLFPNTPPALVPARRLQRYFYSSDFQDKKKEIEQWLALLGAGMERLADQVPTAQHYLRSPLAISRDKHIEFCQFSPDGSFLVWGGRYQLNAISVASLAARQPRVKRLGRWLHSASFFGNDTLTLGISSPPFSSRPYRGTQEWDLATDTWSTETSILTSQQEDALRDKNVSFFTEGSPLPKTGLLHGGKTEVVLDWRQISLYRAGQNKVEETPQLTLTLKLPPIGLVVSPDGSHFVTISPRGLLLWQVTPEQFAVATTSVR